MSLFVYKATNFQNDSSMFTILLFSVSIFSKLKIDFIFFEIESVNLYIYYSNDRGWTHYKRYAFEVDDVVGNV